MIEITEVPAPPLPLNRPETQSFAENRRLWIRFFLPYLDFPPLRDDIRGLLKRVGHHVAVTTLSKDFKTLDVPIASTRKIVRYAASVGVAPPHPKEPNDRA